MEPFKAPPEDWSCELRISSVPRTGEVRTERFTLQLDGAIEHWGARYLCVSPIVADASANITGGRMLVSLHVSADFTTECSRCLRETRLAILGDLRYLFDLDSRDRGDDDDDDLSDDPDGDVDVIKVDAFESSVELAPYIWEALVLELPERALCRDDCRGLCDICGADLNEGDCGCRREMTDPRLEVLKDMMQ